MAKTLKLISNSGIQFENINIKISEDFNKRNKIFYLEEFHIEKEIFWSTVFLTSCSISI